MLMAAAFSNAQVAKVAQAKKLEDAANDIKVGARQMMTWFFPIAIIFTAISPWLFQTFFNPEFAESALVFNAYLLTLASRMMFPQTILIGTGNTKWVMQAALLEVLLNVGLSLILVNLMGLVGIAYATVIAYGFEKVLLTWQAQRNLGLKASSLIPTKRLLLWSLALLAVHVTVVLQA